MLGPEVSQMHGYILHSRVLGLLLLPEQRVWITQEACECLHRKSGYAGPLSSPWWSTERQGAHHGTRRSEAGILCRQPGKTVTLSCGERCSSPWRTSA